MPSGRVGEALLHFVDRLLNGLSALGDPRRAIKEIGFTATVGLDEGLRRLIAWRAEDRRQREANR